MEEMAKMENHISSAAAFVEGGIQDACEDACSICLEEFCQSDPSTVTNCKHEFHLQCILEWSQRSSQCPMCMQHISLKNPTSQELLEAVGRERNIRLNQARTTRIFRHPALGDFELQHGTDSDLEERILQHLAAAAAMGRANHLARREGQRSRSGSHGHPQFLVFSTNPNAPTIGSVSGSSAQRNESESVPAIITASPLAHFNPVGDSANQENHLQADQVPVLTSVATNSQNWTTFPASRLPVGQSTPVGQDRPGSSDFQTFSETLKSRLNAVSMRYKESITKSTRGWRERLFSRSSSVSDIGSEVKREVNAGIDTVSRMIEHLDTRDSRRMGSSVSIRALGSDNEDITGNYANSPSNDTVASTSCITTPGPN